MYSADGSSSSSTCINYYVPLQDGDSTSCKKQHVDVSPKRRAVRILGRRYALTNTGYKFLEIAVNVGPPSYIEIVIGDHRGNELVLSLETWKALYEQRSNVYNYLRNVQCTDTPPYSIAVGPLTVRFSTLDTVILIRLESSNVRLVMTDSTFFYMLHFDRCIDLMFAQLMDAIGRVDAKFQQFSNIASAVPDNTSVSNAIRASECFQKNQLVDCELLALVFH